MEPFYPQNLWTFVLKKDLKSKNWEVAVLSAG